MASRRTVLLSDSSPARNRLGRKHTTRTEFAKRLFRAMVAKEWTQSELARQADLPRDSISRYMRGMNLPDLINLKKLARALSVEEADLLPNYDMQAIDDDDLDPAFEMRAIPDAPDRFFLKVNREVNVATAIKIQQALAEDVVLPAAKAKK